MNELELADFGRLICDVAAGKEMTRDEAKEAYRQVILNIQPELQQGAFLAAHIGRGPTTVELSGAWEAMTEFDTERIDVETVGAVCDIVGTGSDKLKTVNCSTPAALIASACGLAVAKKGARLVTGVSGASDILELLGLNLEAPLAKAAESLERNGICYLPGEAFLKSGWARLIQSMRFTSAFNIVGPLSRPCENTNSIVIGAYAPEVCDQLIDVLAEIEMPAALSPFGMAEGFDDDLGMDEFSVCGVTRVVELRNGRKDVYELTPSDFGVPTRGFASIASGKTAKENADTIMSVLKGEYDSPAADFFCVNAAAALRVSGMAETYATGVEMAKEALASGKAYEKLLALVETQK